MAAPIALFLSVDHHPLQRINSGPEHCQAPSSTKEDLHSGRTVDHTTTV